MGKGKNKYLGSWTETGAKPIEFAFSPLNLLILLEQASKGQDREYNHQDIANWCLKYWEKYSEDETGLDDLEKLAVQLTSEVEAQWDLYLSNTYLLDQLKELDFASVYLPKEWFEQWAIVLRQAMD